MGAQTPAAKSERRPKKRHGAAVAEGKQGMAIRIEILKELPI